jgi:hypothetical protein
MLNYVAFKKWLDESESIDNGNIEHSVKYGSIVITNKEFGHSYTVKGSDELRLSRNGNKVTLTSDSEDGSYVVTYKRTS